MSWAAVLGAIGAAGAAGTLGGVLSGFLPTHRQCSIEITNDSQYTLNNPSVYTNSGSCAEPLPVVLDPASSGSALFTKTPNAACGSVGVFTYDLIDKSRKKATMKIAVMFSVPYDFNWYTSWHAVGIFDLSTKCNYDLYKQMYYNTSRRFVRKKAGNNIEYKKDRVTIVASMGDSHQPVLKVELRDD